MKTYLFISSAATALCLALLGLKAPGKVLSKQFCNDKFHYCLDFPESMFAAKYFSTNMDSLLFTSLDSLGELSVIATASLAKLDSHEAFDQRMRSMVTPGDPPPHILSIINGDDYYEVNFLFDGKWIHQKAGFFRDCDVLFTIQVPVNRPELMVRMKEDVMIEFR